MWFKILPSFLGVSKRHNLLMNFLTFARAPKEAVGGIARLINETVQRTQCIEYNMIDALLKGSGQTEGDVAMPSTDESPYPGNVNTFIISLPEMAQVLEETGGGMPEFVNPKYADETKTVFKAPARLECMMQDYALLIQDHSRVSFTKYNRIFSFAATKNSLEGAVTNAANGLPPQSAGSNEVDFFLSNQ